MLRPIAFCFFALAAVPASACDCHELSDPVAGHPGKTWFDIAKAIVPDLHWQGERAVGSTSVPLRYVDPDEEEEALPERQFIVHGLEVKPLLAEGRALTLVSFGLGPADGWAIDIEALALFDETLVLLDAINIGQDKTTGTRGAPIRISATDEAVLTYSEHFNSNQTYGSYALVMVKGGKWQTIGTISTLSDRWCAHQRTQTLDVSAPEAGAGRWPITVTVTDTQTFDETMDCGDQVAEPDFTRIYATTYRWSASMGAYVADGEGFAGLHAINQERY